jgi:plasmid stability protein
MTIRLDPELRAKLEKRAKKYRRSVGAELQYLAEIGLRTEDPGEWVPQGLSLEMKEHA